MTAAEWLRMLREDAPPVADQFQRLIDAGFTFDNSVDCERHADLAFVPPFGGRAYPTSVRVTVRRRRVFEITLDARLSLISASVEADQGELEPIAFGNDWEPIIDAILETDA